MFRLDQRDERFVQDARFRFSFRISTRASPEAVFDLVSDAAYDPEWFPDFVSAEWETPPPRGAGSLRRYRLKYMTILEEFLVWERGRRLIFRVNACSLPMLRAFAEHYVFTPRADGGTELRWELCYEPARGLRLLHPLVRPWFGRDLEKAARQLQARVDRL